MNKNVTIGLSVVVLLIVIAVGVSLNNRREVSVESGSNKENSVEVVSNETVKEFAVQSFVEFMDGKPAPKFAPNKLSVKKGDRVRLRVTVTKGVHDFNIDEYNIHAVTPLDEEITIEFVADKAGDFVYYCNKTGHRAAGHWGTLTVTE